MSSHPEDSVSREETAGRPPLHIASSDCWRRRRRCSHHPSSLATAAALFYVSSHVYGATAFSGGRNRPGASASSAYRRVDTAVPSMYTAEQLVGEGDDDGDGGDQLFFDRGGYEVVELLQDPVGVPARPAAAASRPAPSRRTTASPAAVSATSPIAYTTHSKANDMKFLFDEMLSHDLLTKGEEVSLAREVQRGIRLSENLQNLLEARAGLPITREEDRGKSRGRKPDPTTGFKKHDLDSILAAKLGGTPAPSIARSQPPSGGQVARTAAKAAVNEIMDDVVRRNGALEEREVEILAAVSGAAFQAQRLRPIEFAAEYGGLASVAGADGAAAPAWLSEDDIVRVLGLPGGRAEMDRILAEAAAAREKLVVANLRLVMSISNKWLRRHRSMRGKGPSASGGAGGTATMYDGDWETPGLDELIQEGVCGLVRAVDRYDPEMGYRFSTYCHPWITNQIRLLMMGSTTGTLRVPVHIHDLKTSANQIRAREYRSNGENPSLAYIAAEMGVTERRLRGIEQVTRGPLSIDTAVGSGPQRGSGAGEGSASPDGLWSDTVIDADQVPDEFVELSLLRQTLEDAMAAQLSPHERDVVRLRLGLDDGVTMTVREITELCGGLLSQQDIRAAEYKAYKKLRSPYSLHHFGLLDFFEGGENTMTARSF